MVSSVSSCNKYTRFSHPVVCYIAFFRFRPSFMISYVLFVGIFFPLTSCFNSALSVFFQFSGCFSLAFLLLACESIFPFSLTFGSSPKIYFSTFSFAAAVRWRPINKNYTTRCNWTLLEPCLSTSTTESKQIYSTHKIFMWHLFSFSFYGCCQCDCDCYYFGSFHFSVIFSLSIILIIIIIILTKCAS